MSGRRPGREENQDGFREETKRKRDEATKGNYPGVPRREKKGSHPCHGNTQGSRGNAEPKANADSRGGEPLDPKNLGRR